MLEHPNADQSQIKAEQDNVYGSAALYYPQYQQWYQNQYQAQHNWNQMMAMQHVQAQMYHPHHYYQNQAAGQAPMTPAEFHYNAAHADLKPVEHQQQNVTNTMENYAGFHGGQMASVQAGSGQVPVAQALNHHQIQLQAHQITLKKPRVTFSSRQVVRLEQEYSKQR